MSENPYEVLMPQGPFGKAVDAAIAEVNALPYTDDDHAADVENAARWAAIENARIAAERHAAVLPIATIEVLKAYVEGNYDGPLTKRLLVGLLDDAIDKVDR